MDCVVALNSGEGDGEEDQGQGAFLHVVASYCVVAWLAVQWLVVATFNSGEGDEEDDEFKVQHIISIQNSCQNSTHSIVYRIVQCVIYIIYIEK